MHRIDREANDTAVILCVNIQYLTTLLIWDLCEPYQI